MSRTECPFKRASGSLTLTLSRERERGQEAPPPFGLRYRGHCAALLAGAALLLAGGCAKVSTPGGGGTGSTSGTGGISGIGSGGVAGPGSGGFVGRGEDGGLIASDAGTTVCQEGKYKSVPQIPTVYLMVDRSGSMFDCISTLNTVEASCPTPADTPWVKLKDGILNVVKALQAQVRFGFAAFTGTNPRFGGVGPIVNKVAPNLSNYDQIATLYNSLPFQPNTTEPGKKFETPSSQSLPMVGAELIADQSAGAKYILYVTDGEPDYCGDGNALCPPDGVVAQLQKLKAQGITTIVFGLKSAIAQDLPLGVLEAFATAGAGEPTVAPLRGTNAKIEDLYDQCFSTGAPADDAAGGWTREFVASGKPMMRGQTLGTYAATAGPTLPYKPDVANQEMLVNQLSKALSGVKSCTFDLNDFSGKKLTVDQTMLDKVAVKMENRPVALDATNGWRMNSASELELVGSACTDWRMTQNMNIDIQIPCAAIIIK
ncbi:MAG: vWA domain-containing protein [Myxococcales bacterium]